MSPLSVEALYAQYGPMVLRRCRRLLRDEQRAVDAMHDVFVQVLQHQHRLTSEAPSSLLYRLATNVCLNRLRSNRRWPEDHDDEVVLDIAHDLDVESATHAKSLLSRLFGDEPESTATIAVLHYLDGLTWVEVAAEVNMSVSGVRKRARALGERLKSLNSKEVTS